MSTALTKAIWTATPAPKAQLSGSPGTRRRTSASSARVSQASRWRCACWSTAGRSSFSIVRGRRGREPAHQRAPDVRARSPLLRTGTAARRGWRQDGGRKPPLRDRPDRRVGTGDTASTAASSAWTAISSAHRNRTSASSRRSAPPRAARAWTSSCARTERGDGTFRSGAAISRSSADPRARLPVRARSGGSTRRWWGLWRSGRRFGPRRRRHRGRAHPGRDRVRAGAIVVATNTPVNDRVAIHTKQAAYRTYVIAAARCRRRHARTRCTGTPATPITTCGCSRADGDADDC